MPPWCSIVLWILFLVLFWITFAFFMLSGTNMLSLVTVFALMIVMRQQNNKLPLQAWIAFWLSAYHVWGSMFSKMSIPAYQIISVILSAVRFFAISPDTEGNYYQMPTTTFWIIIVALTPTQKYSRGGLVWNFLFTFNTYIKYDGIHIPGVVVSWWVLLVPLAPLVILAIPAMCIYSISCPEHALPEFSFFLAIGVLHQQMWPWNEDFGLKWMVAWFLLYNTLVFVFSPHVPFKPVPWYGSWIIAIVLLGWAFRPDQSFYQFLSWAATIWVLRLVVYMALLHYIPPVEGPPIELLQQYFEVKLRQPGTPERSTTGRFQQPYGAARPIRPFDDPFYRGGQ